jgi:prolipoprotein diacylglyceryltransferase
MRHPTQLYFALAALLSAGALFALARRNPPVGTLFVAYLALQGLAWLLLEPFRADSLLLPLGLRASQLLGLGLVLGGIWWARGRK